jgi:hypothetical protein
MQVIGIDPLTEFFDSFRNELTKKRYTERLVLFFDYLKLKGDLQTRARTFASNAKKDPTLATYQINQWMRIFAT